MTSVVSVRGLRVRYPASPGGGPDTAQDALADVSFDLAAGDVVALVGAPRSGRSTLLRSLVGIVPRLVPAEVAGSISVAGLDPAETTVADMARAVAIVLDDPEAQLSQLTVADEVAFGLENLGVPVAEMRDRVAAALARVRLTGFEERNPLTLSGGEQQRLVVACAVAMRPRLLLLDDPTASLDPRSAREVVSLAAEAAASDGAAVAIATHDVDLVAEVARRVLVLDRGRLVLDGSPGEAFASIVGATGSTGADPSAGSGRFAAPGVPVPQVAALCRRLDRAASPLPVTVAAANAWVRARR